MADSNLTKRAFASAMKALMTERPFEKISVGVLCDRCGLNRKSFYYHFKDKYDLVNWIFDTEFLPVVAEISLNDIWDILLRMCRYMYNSHGFYRQALQITGQNAFSEHFREMLYTAVMQYLQILFEGQAVTEFHVTFFADAIVCAIERWLQKMSPETPECFIDQLRSCVYLSADKLYHSMPSDP